TPSDEPSDRPDYRSAYTDLAGADRGPSLARVERLLLVDTLRALGPDQPTLCEGWTTHHLVAHLKIREGNLWDETRTVLTGEVAEVRQAPTPRATVVVAGLPSETILFLYGRRPVADVDIAGTDEAVATFTRSERSA